MPVLAVRTETVRFRPADAFSVMTAVLDPEIIVIGGGVSKAGPVLLDYVQKYYKPCAFTLPHMD